MDLITLGIIVMLIVISLDLVGVFMIMRSGLAHLEHGPSRAEDSGAVVRIKALNAERAAKLEAAQARAALSAPAEAVPAQAEVAKPRASSRRRAAATAEGN